MAQLGWAREQTPLQTKRADQQNEEPIVLTSSRLPVKACPRRVEGLAVVWLYSLLLLLHRVGTCSVETMYERNRRNFFCNLPEPGKQELLQSLKQRYRVLLRSYFDRTDTAEEALERFVSTTFSADVPAQLLVKIHIQIMDQLATQLKMEGHSTAFLKDYRLALIDVMARLAETYRNAMAMDPPSSQSTRSPETT